MFPVEKLPKALSWQLATSATGNFPARKVVPFQMLMENGEVAGRQSGNFPPATWQLQKIVRYQRLREVARLPEFLLSLRERRASAHQARSSVATCVVGSGVGNSMPARSRCTA